jgi:hypothetical protein
VRLIAFAILPIIIIAVSTTVWGAIAAVKRNKSYLVNHLVSTIVIVLFLSHPTILRTMLSCFACEEIESGEGWLIENMDIRCWNNEHTFYALAVAIPGLLVWGISTPAFFLYGIVKVKSRL